MYTLIHTLVCAVYTSYGTWALYFHEQQPFYIYKTWISIDFHS